MASQKWSKERVKHALTAVQLVMTVATLAMVAHLVNRPTSPLITSDNDLATDPCSLLRTYPERFRTTALQKTYEKSADDILKKINHGCCSTKQLFYSPKSITCIGGTNDGTTRTVAVFADYRQYFQYDSCTTKNPCPGTECKCDDAALATVVYDNGEEGCAEERYGICAFKPKGCCKCVNTKAEEAGEEEDV